MNDNIFNSSPRRRPGSIVGNPSPKATQNSTALRILSSFALAALIGAAAIVGGIGVMILSSAIASLMIFEWLRLGTLPLTTRALGAIWLVIVLLSAIALSQKVWVMLLLLITISATDIGAWFFGRRIKSDKLWPNVSAGKTWGGHIAGAVCGTLACFATGFLLQEQIIPQLIWIGLGIATLSQYGDLTESYFKRKAGVKDSSNLIPGHGGFLDRFDGWLYALPLMALISEVL
ncbi:MAG: phosphatidate cytidylyltransferase [Rickettsiales bacterium]|jgi:phosphatidate cytidylyltransferase|nr:phosphatidate cytidylyltransferase [Rickettsiales bacterium]